MNDGVQVIVPREVPLGGPRAMTVRRTLPARQRSFVGAWCFVDHYGPDDVSATGGMDVAPHPHCGLATVSWLFSGEVEHRDSLGTLALVRPGEVNLMTAGRGISHSEVSTPATTVLHGAQLWVVLPSSVADVEPRFEHHVPDVLQVAPGVRAQVFVGSLWGATSPVRVESPLVGAEVVLDPGADGGRAGGGGFRGVGARRHGLGAPSTVEGLARAELGVVGAGRHPGSVQLAAGDGGRACSCSGVRRSGRRSSCGGTSSVAPTRRSSRPGRRGRVATAGPRTSPAASAGSTGMPGRSPASRRRRCRAFTSSRGATVASAGSRVPSAGHVLTRFVGSPGHRAH